MSTRPEQVDLLKAHFSSPFTDFKSLKKNLKITGIYQLSRYLFDFTLALGALKYVFIQDSQVFFD